MFKLSYVCIICVSYAWYACMVYMQVWYICMYGVYGMYGTYGMYGSVWYVLPGMVSYVWSGKIWCLIGFHLARGSPWVGLPDSDSLIWIWRHKRCAAFHWSFFQLIKITERQFWRVKHRNTGDNFWYKNREDAHSFVDHFSSWMKLQNANFEL